VAPLTGIELADSGAGDGSYTVQGLASVFDQLSHDLGDPKRGFSYRIKVARGAFTDVLASKPEVHFVWDHDTRYTLAATANGTLELTQINKGLRMWARPAPVSYAADLRTLLARKDITQMSMAFMAGAVTWEEREDGKGNVEIVRTIETVQELYDVSVCAQGLFPQTDIELVAREAAAAGIDLSSFTPTDRAPRGRVEDDESPAETAGAEEHAEDRKPWVLAAARARVRVARARNK
jgi:uncharacterized protein